MKKKLRIGTRGSKLALWQANKVAGLLRKGGVETEIVPIETAGDKILDVAIGKIGSKGVFTEEIEEQLAAGTIELAVHSAKDVQSDLGEAFEIAAFVERERPYDVLIGRNREVSILRSSRNWLIGSSSMRRVSLLKRNFPYLDTIAVRGNLQTRIRKMDEGQCDALLLAYAGVRRMGYEEMIIEEMPADVFTPPAGQGCIAVETHVDLDEATRRFIKDHVNHGPTEACVKAERAFLKELQGGCSIPSFVYAVIENDLLRVRGGIVSLDGSKEVRMERSGVVQDAETLGLDLGRAVLQQGGKEILAEIRSGNK